MKQNASISLGGIVMIEKVEKEFGFFTNVFAGVGVNSDGFIGCVKLQMYNRLTHAVSTHKILET